MWYSFVLTVFSLFRVLLLNTCLKKNQRAIYLYLLTFRSKSTIFRVEKKENVGNRTSQYQFIAILKNKCFDIKSKQIQNHLWTINLSVFIVLICVIRRFEPVDTLNRLRFAKREQTLTDGNKSERERVRVHEIEPKRAANEFGSSVYKRVLDRTDAKRDGKDQGKDV